MGDASQFWAGQDGDAYTARNRVDWQRRIPFWREVIRMTGARSVYEFGCNAGWNLSAIKRAFPDVMVQGEDLNGTALTQARMAGLTTWGVHRVTPQLAELTFTAGVLIHVPPDELEAFMRRVAGASTDWVLAIEYEAPEEQEIAYQGRGGLLWKRPFGKLYRDLGLQLKMSYNAVGFDRCTAWLMRKP